jgi:hypothetical protein
MVVFSKIISSGSKDEFEADLNNFIKGKEQYSVQYRPVDTKIKIIYTALVMYQIPIEENNS